ncbi:MAG: 50S ribosomal protein L25/general stress protein Ctc [Gammaproteobacteria bacterium]|nr:MAG: 50S ribosomal protein L25/general stress protein Ctc [Gammaproteobacteria bacterium]
MSVDFTLNAELRNEQDLGKGASRRLRKKGRVPAVIYGGGEDSVSVTLDHNSLVHSLEQEAFYSHILNVEVAGKSQRAILRDLQRHPYKSTVLHMDLLRVREDTAINVHVPLHFLNEDTCPGVKLDGGVISHNTTEIEISCLPKDLPEFIEVDAGELKLNDSLHLSDIKVADGVTIVELSHGEDHDHVVVSVHVKRAVEEEPVASDEVAEGEEVEGEESKEEGDDKGDDKSSGDDS